MKPPSESIFGYARFSVFLNGVVAFVLAFVSMMG